MSSFPKYKAPEPVKLDNREWPGKTVEKSPVWCSVDLRDGNQALPNPMTPDQKLEYFKLLAKIGFKDIEVAFPSASQDDFDFTRCLIEGGHIPEDIFIMGLVQSREHLIARTFEAFRGVPRGIVHVYLATSELHMKQVFGLNREKTLDMAIKSVRQVRDISDTMPDSDIRLQFSPEEFTDTDLDFALEICEAVFAEWGKATPEKPLIMNLPATVERRPPNHYADMIEWFCKHFSKRDSILVSLHSHNDQGMAVAATELSLLAGADRVEGTLFGHGERTGNVDLITVANNLYSRGIETGLDFSDMDNICETVERLTGMDTYYRQPYSGDLVFTAFSGSHQDAIRKGINNRHKAAEIFSVEWKVPYLHLDPSDLGRKFERLIRINSQSGKGGVAWILEVDHGISLPKQMQPQMGKAMQEYSDRVAREITGGEVLEIFKNEFICPVGPYKLIGYWPRPDDNDPTQVHGEVKLLIDGEERIARADGNGPISAFVHAIRELGLTGFTVDDYDEQAVGHGADATAYAYVPLKLDDGRTLYGVGTDTNIDQAAVKAIIAALNRKEKSV